MNGPRTPLKCKTVEKIFAFPDFRHVYQEALKKLGCPFKAFLEVQVELMLACGWDGGRTNAEEACAQTVAQIRKKWEGSPIIHVQDYLAGASAGLMQGLETAFAVVQNMGKHGATICELDKPK